MNKEKITNYGLGIFGAIGTIVTLIIIFTPNVQNLSSQISSDLDLVYKDCKNLNNEQKTHLQQTLQSAEKALNVEKDYGKAVDLLNSVSGELWICKPLMEISPAGALLAVLTLFILMTAVGIRMILKNIGHNDDERNKNLN